METAVPQDRRTASASVSGKCWIRLLKLSQEREDSRKKAPEQNKVRKTRMANKTKRSKSSANQKECRVFQTASINREQAWPKIPKIIQKQNFSNSRFRNAASPQKENILWLLIKIKQVYYCSNSARRRTSEYFISGQVKNQVGLGIFLSSCLE